VNNPLEVINSCIELLKCVGNVCETELEEQRFLETTEKELELYSENPDSFYFIGNASSECSHKAIIDDRNFGLVVVVKYDKVIAYARFEPSDSLVKYLPNKSISLLELA
jgi:hypothetical protein